MTSQQKIVVQKLTDDLSRQSSVFGLVLIGSHATGLADTMSDLDFWITVKDGKESYIAKRIEQILQKIGPLDIRFHFDQNPHRRSVFHLAHTPPWHKIDIAIAPLSQAYIYTVGVDAPVIVLVNKRHCVKFKTVDRNSIVAAAKKKLTYAKELLLVHRAEINKYCIRKRFLEAFFYYDLYALRPLVDALRAAYTPTKLGFSLKHIYEDMPSPIIKKLEKLYTPRTVKDIAANLKCIVKLMENLRS